MSIHDEWLERFKTVVAHEIERAGGRRSDGYRAVEEKTGLGYDYIYQIYTGKPEGRPKRPSAEAMDSLRAAYGPMLTTTTAEPSNVAQAPALRTARQIPVVGEVKGGDDGYLHELQYPVGHGDGFVEYWCRDGNAYALRVRGDSMHPRYRAGEFVVVTPSIEAQQGSDVVVALKDGRKLLKQLNWKRGDEIQLLSINNHFAPMTISLDAVLAVHRVAGAVGSDALVKA